MLKGIKSWLPLYFSGSIDPYVCTLRRDSRFSHTLFLCPGQACIASSVVAGREKQALTTTIPPSRSWITAVRNTRRCSPSPVPFCGFIRPEPPKVHSSR